MPCTRTVRSGVAAAGVALLSLVALACGSEEGTRGEQAPSTGICDAVEAFRLAERDGDRTAMADALRSLPDDLPDDVADDVEAVVQGLSASPSSQEPEGDAQENDEADAAFRAFAVDECGDGAVAPAGDGAGATSSTIQTTTTSAPDADTTEPDASADSPSEPDCPEDPEADGPGGGTDGESYPEGDAGDDGSVN